MNLPAASTEQAQRTELAAVIEKRRREIEKRWLELVQREIDNSEGLNLTELRDGIDDYLMRLALSLRAADPMNESGKAAWSDVAEEHAIARVRLGFDIDELVHEFVVLRRVLVDAAREERLIQDGQHMERLAELIDAAISAAVKSYVDSRDYAARRTEAEHIGFITHELRNPLSTAILGIGQLRKLAQGPEQRKIVELVDRNLVRLKDLIDSVLLAERLEAKGVDVHLEDVSLDEVLAPALSSAQVHAQAKGLTLATRIDGNVLVRADRQLTTSILSNLLDNAIKFSETGQLEVETDDRPGEMCVNVWDNCQGISSEELRTIFEPFRRGHRGAAAGSGLGLAIARRAAEAQGGTIAADSPANAGCHFWFTIRKSPH